jgi:D-lactate dehydrogenase
VTRRHVPAGAPDAVYLPSCLNTIFGAADGGPGVMWAVLTLAERAGISLHVPEGIAGACCGTPWSSKGLPGGYETMAERVRRTVAAGDADSPIVTDASSCTEGFTRQLAPRQVLEAVTFVASTVLPRLTVSGRLGSLSLHPTCSSTRTGANAAMLTVAEAIAEDVVVADDWACCGFAGDRGLLHPELTASATAPEAASVRRRTFDAYASVNRACEIGMTRATGSTYQHLLELLERATRPPAHRHSGATHGRIS